MEDKIKIVRTTNENPDFILLVAALDKSLWERYPESNENYWENNILELNPNSVIVYFEGAPVGCGCFKKHDKNTIEIKRMFVSPDARGLGLAKKILQELEQWARDQGFNFSILETLYKQHEAISLYEKVGYAIVANYEPYIGLKDSICMKKKI